MFYKVVLTGSYYTSLDKDKNSILAEKFKVGNIQIFHGNFAGVPINRSFYAGGSNSVAGLVSQSVFPVGSQQVLGHSGQSVKGGTFLMEGSFELRKRFLENFGFALFQIMGIHGSVIISSDGTVLP